MSFPVRFTGSRARFEQAARRSIVAAVVAVAFTACATPQPVVTSQTLPLTTHAAFFSQETGAPLVFDPQVFVADPEAPAATGAQNIAHVAGYRNARPYDAASTPVFSATGVPLGMTSTQWFAAGGTARLTPLPDGTTRIALALDGLRPGGVYDLFENHFDRQPVGFTPLDGTGATTRFVAGLDGKADVIVLAPQPLTHDNAILVVYHSDRETHGLERGPIGMTAHHQAIVRIP